MKIKLKFDWNVRLVFRLVRHDETAICLGKCESAAAMLFFGSHPAKMRWMALTVVVKFCLESVFKYSGLYENLLCTGAKLSGL